MALDIGAARSGDYGYLHAVPVDRRSGRTEAKVLIFPLGIVVNQLGKRFTDEGAGTDYRNNDIMCHRIQVQPNGVGYAICDAKINDIPEYTKAIWNKPFAISMARAGREISSPRAKTGLPQPASSRKSPTGRGRSTALPSSPTP
jgi:hypothetical protein